MTTKTTFKGFYGTATDGQIVYVINHGTVNGVESLKVEYCRFGQYFSGGGTLIGRNIHGTKRFAWVPKDSVTRNKKGQNGTMWN